MRAFTMFQTKAIRHLLIAMTLVIVGLPSAVVVAGSGATAVQAAVVSRIDVRGNRRVDAETIRSYVTVKPGRNFTSFDTDESLRALFATGLFSDVRISRAGRTLQVLEPIAVQQRVADFVARGKWIRVVSKNGQVTIAGNRFNAGMKRSGQKVWLAFCAKEKVWIITTSSGEEIKRSNDQLWRDWIANIRGGTLDHAKG